VTPTAEADRLASFVHGILGPLTPDEAAEWTDAITQGEANGTFFIPRRITARWAGSLRDAATVRTTKLYGRAGDKITLDEVERISV
jgi:hypothetical protein